MVSVIIPVYNAASHLSLLLQCLKEQTVDHELIFIDSESSDETPELLLKENMVVTRINKSDFNHGATRNLGMQLATNNTIVYMTQDALPASPFTLERLVNALYSSTDVAMAYGRQLPYPDTGIFGRFARLMNYPSESIIKKRRHIPEMGIKTCSCSNSFAAYRKNELIAIGGFPTHTILGEDVSVAARFILQGKAVAYCAESEVYHSHNYSLLEEFKRYFDIGVFHDEQQSVLKEFRSTESEGLKYVAAEWAFLYRERKLYLIPAQVARTFAKYAGYRLGRNEKIIPGFIKPYLSMHKQFWLQPYH